MIRADQIPDEVVVAVERLLNLYLVGGLTQSEDASIGHALVEVALAAWPGMSKQGEVYGLQSEYWLELPLPQEERDVNKEDRNGEL